MGRILQSLGSFFLELFGLKLQVADFAAFLLGAALHQSLKTQQHAAAAEKHQEGHFGDNGGHHQNGGHYKKADGVGHIVLAFEESLELTLEVCAHILSS